MTTPGRVVVVGACAAGLAAVEGLRRAGFGGELTLIGEEAYLPSDRLPISKRPLSGAWTHDRVRLRSSDGLTSLDRDLRLRVRATGLDARARKLTTVDGTVLGYDTAVVATGVRPRRLSGTEGVAGVHQMRPREDALALRGSLGDGKCDWLTDAPSRPRPSSWASAPSPTSSGLRAVARRSATGWSATPRCTRVRAFGRRVTWRAGPTRVVAAVGVNLVRPLRALRRLVAERTPWDEALAMALPAQPTQ